MTTVVVQFAISSPLLSFKICNEIQARVILTGDLTMGGDVTCEETSLKNKFALMLMMIMKMLDTAELHCSKNQLKNATAMSGNFVCHTKFL